LTSYKKNKSVLASLNTQLLEATKEHDYNTFLLDELLVANLKAGQQEELESLYEQLSNVELIRENLDKSLALANEDQYGILSNLREAKSAIQKVSAFSPEYNQLLERITSTAIELDDIFDDVSRLSEQLVQDPQQLELTGQKLQTIYNLQKKHQVNTVDELLEVQEALDNQALSAGELESQISLLQNTIAESQLHLDKLALQINESRTAAIPVMSARLIEILSTLGMPNVRFDIKITSSEQYFQNGKDELQFLFSANKGSDFGLLKKVASGGEMSRIMLAVKAILAQYSKLPTIIFDEIDTGVSGEIAHKMGDIMKSMSTDMQVFAITHLPQIAAKGHTHYKVFKSVSGERTNSELKLLTNEERVNEIAQMLSGSVISDSAINHAKALLD
ncbi:MAG TPA: DNA repair protein RecN, partial [Flavobacterium sp.]|nr:DNA repair protein RecN [Flavobacterium sp.]